MTPEEFRAAGHLLIDWIADFRSNIDGYPVQARVSPGQVRAHFAPIPPTDTIGMDAIIDDLDQFVMPGMTHVQHPRYFGFFPANSALSAVLGDLASSGLGALGLSWESNPSLTEIEEVMCDWMRQLVGLSPNWVGTIQDTASTACLVSLLIARERATNHSQLTGGMQQVAQPLTVYSSGQAHSSIQKAALLAGFGFDNVRHVPVDPVTFDMQPSALRAMLTADVAAGRQPAAIVVAVGSTACTAFDPVEEVVAIASEFGCFVHVDAAMAGTAMLVPELRHLWHGVEGADAVTWNPHKWMGTSLDCSLYYVRNQRELNSVMATSPSYLASVHDGAVTQYRDWGIPLGRRFRSLKLWFQLMLDGVESVQARVRRDMANAQWLANQVDACPGWTRVAPVRLQTVCLRHEPIGLDGNALDTHTRAWAAAVNATGRCYVTPSLLAGQWMVRVSIGAESTSFDHVREAWDLIQRSAESLIA